MTETQWLASVDPTPMVAFLQRNKPNGRKLQLFAVACCRRVWRLFADGRNRSAVDLAERFADGQASEMEREATNRASENVYANTMAPGSGFSNAAQGISGSGWTVAQAATLAACVYNDNSDAGFTAGAAAQQAIEAIAEESKESNPAGVIADYASRVAMENELAAQVALLHCIFGNPFHPVGLNPVVLAWNDATVVRIARAAYDERHLPSGELDPHLLVVLADALEEAGAPDKMVAHLRLPGPHVRGCFVVDLCLGLS